MHPSAERLLTVPVFRDATPEQRERLAEWFDVDEYDAGTRLTREGAFDYSFFVLDDGEAGVEVDGEEIARLGSGDVYGELSILGDGHRRANVVARTRVRVLSMPGTRFRELQRDMPEVAARIEAIGAERARTLDEG